MVPLRTNLEHDTTTSLLCGSSAVQTIDVRRRLGKLNALIWPMLTPVRVLKVEGIDLFGERVPPSPTSRHHHIKITQKAMERGQGFREKEWQGRMDLRHQASGLTPLLLCVVVRTTHCACGLRRLDGPCSCMFTFFCQTGRIQIVQIGALFSPPIRFVLILLQLLAPVSCCHWLRESMLNTHT